MKPRLLMVGRTRYALPLSPSLARKFEALSEELLSRVEHAIGLARRDVMGKAVRKAS